MNINRKKNIIYLLIIYVVLVVGFYFIGDEEIRTKRFYLELPARDGVVNEINKDVVLEQTFLAGSDVISKFTFDILTYGRINNGFLKLTLKEVENQSVLEQLSIDARTLKDGSVYEWVLGTNIENTKGKQYSITIESTCSQGEAPTIYCTNEILQGTALQINNMESGNTLCFSYEGREITWFGDNYWLATSLIGGLIASYFIYSYICIEKGKRTFWGKLEYVLKRYHFLIEQLVSREFKTKYKRSVLGYLWSFLNPLLTMSVQYIVFSTVFRSDIKNFPVYLLSGIILFNFFTDAVGQGLSAIVNNSALITKVYVPKYIYPITKVMSSSINLMISIIPLLMVTVLTGAPIRKAILLLPFGIICLIIFCIGLSLALCSAMVFFRDTQYLWGIISLAWTYATPLFYPESIIPEQFKMIPKLNPMYYYIKFARTILIEGVSPEISIYVYCLMFSVAMLVIGCTIFKKTQNKFVLYI